MADIPVERWGQSGAEGSVLRDRWWLEEDPAPHISSIVKKLEEQQADLNDERLVYARLYANQPLTSLYSLGVLRRSMPSEFGQNRLTWNVCQNATDTAASKIAKNKPRVLFLTSGGDWEMQERAQGLTKFIDGLFYGSDFYEIGQQVFVDACVFGTGLAALSTEDGEIKAERVLECEVFVNEAEAINGKPRSMHRRMYMHREVAAAQHGTDATRDRILKMPGVDLSGVHGDARSDMIEAIESWHLPSSKKAKDGRHALTIGDVTVFSKPYKKDYFPIVKFTWNNRLVGWRGQGLIEQLVGIQLEINKLLRTIQAAQHLMAVNRVVVERGSKVIKSHLNNEIGAILEYTGAPPQIMEGRAVPAELYQQLDRLYQKAFEITGISMLSATAQKPAGLNSAVSLREYHDIESERFVVVGQRFEQWFIDAAKIMIDLARDLYANNPDLRIKAPGTKLLEEIKWSKVNLKEDEYFMKVYPTSILPTTPAGRLQKIQELYEAQFIDRDTAMQLLDFPDLESAMSLQMAGAQDAKHVIDRIVRDGKYETPEPYMNLQLAIKLAQSAYLKGRADGLPEKRRELLTRFIDECRELLNPEPAFDPNAQQAQPAPGAQPAPAPQPGAMPQVPMGAAPQDMTAVPSQLPALPQ